MQSDCKRHAFMRFGMSGAVFTVLGPALLWCMYPLGPYIAVLLTEACIHIMRFFAFRRLIFPVQKGYRVNPARYLVSALPVTISSLACVALLKDSLNRTTLTLTSAVISLVIGFLWSKYVYSWNRR